MERLTQTLRRPPDDDPRGQAVRYLIVAGCGYVLAMSLYVAELAVGVPPYPAIAFVFVANGFFNFVMVRLWAFPPSGRRVRSEMTRFWVVAAGSLTVNYSSFAVLYSGLGVTPTVAQAIAIAIAAPFGFIANRLWAFRGASSTP